MRIKLFCAAGMSTSLLVAKMKEVANERGLDIEIKAYPVGHIDKEIETADIVLLGPQVSYLQKEVKAKVLAHNIPFGVIPMVDYGMLNGKGALDYALKLTV